jgi:ornithine carbamoyltransferase
MATRHLLSFNDISKDELLHILDHAIALKKNRGNDTEKPLAGKTVAMIFSKSSTRTRVSFQVGIYELGGQHLFLGQDNLQLGRGESMSDTAKVLSRYVHAAVIRTYNHADVEDFAAHGNIPVINALTDSFHPCQLLADLQTIQERSGKLEGVRVTYLGDGANNMANSWVLAAKLSGIHLTIAAPDGFHPDAKLLDSAPGKGTVDLFTDPVKAVKNADYLYTDVWVSMGMEREKEKRIKLFQPYQVNAKLMASAMPDVKVMHCLPAYRGLEITADVMDAKKSIIWDEAENRLHAQKAAMAFLLR